jgi:hypothetical protein
MNPEFYESKRIPIYYGISVGDFCCLKLSTKIKIPSIERPVN